MAAADASGDVEEVDDWWEENCSIIPPEPLRLILVAYLGTALATFADDLKLLYSYFIKDFDSTLMQKAIATVSDWCESKSMKVAPTKTFHVQFGPSNPNAKYSVNNIEIERKEVVRDLGFYIKNDCSIIDHLDIITTNANRKYYSIFKKIIIKDEKI
uniref:Uncharacterized protein n=1 Tax=Panagrolaimus davidi TaxID=227884 RepID=A0A914QFB7_9BILA